MCVLLLRPLGLVNKKAAESDAICKDRNIEQVEAASTLQQLQQSATRYIGKQRICFGAKSRRNVASGKRDTLKAAAAATAAVAAATATAAAAAGAAEAAAAEVAAATAAAAATATPAAATGAQAAAAAAAAVKAAARAAAAVKAAARAVAAAAKAGAVKEAKAAAAKAAAAKAGGILPEYAEDDEFDVEAWQQAAGIEPHSN
ncbi:hypothetical protein ACSSS7_000866 [Eimeria intestinalis]